MQAVIPPILLPSSPLQVRSSQLGQALKRHIFWLIQHTLELQQHVRGQGLFVSMGDVHMVWRVHGVC